MSMEYAMFLRRVPGPDLHLFSQDIAARERAMAVTDGRKELPPCAANGSTWTGKATGAP